MITCVKVDMTACKQEAMKTCELVSVIVLYAEYLPAFRLRLSDLR